MKKAKRFNEGKRRWSLLDLKTLEGLIQVLEFGAEKYGDYNWQKGLPVTEVYESLMRHIIAWKDGKDIDDESGLSHLDHAICNLYFLKWYSFNLPEVDDRKKNYKATNVLEMKADNKYDNTWISEQEIEQKV